MRSEPHGLQLQGKRMNLIMFYGTGCPHCHVMDTRVRKLEKELKIKIEKLEVWNDAKNAAKMDAIDKGKCGGVPFFWNAKAKQRLCGETDYDMLKDWALGEL
jgi:thiol-disulfide isomerase/thioredoxin